MVVATILRNIKITFLDRGSSDFYEIWPDDTLFICTNHNCQISFVFGVYFAWFPLLGGCE